METELWAIGLVLFACVIGAFGAILLKISSDKVSLNPKSIIFNKALAAGISLYGLSTIFFIAALRGGELSVLYPLVSTAYIWIALLSMVLLKEKMNSMKWVGILLIIAGVSLIGYGS